jgi:hypothetical protein
MDCDIEITAVYKDGSKSKKTISDTKKEKTMEILRTVNLTKKIQIIFFKLGNDKNAELKFGHLYDNTISLSGSMKWLDLTDTASNPIGFEPYIEQIVAQEKALIESFNIESNTDYHDRMIAE